MLKHILCLALCVAPILASSCSGICDVADLKLINNRYDGVVIAINPDVPENPEIINKLQEIWTDASRVLWVATNYRAYFGSITILVPQTWTSGPYAVARGEAYEKANIIVADVNPAFGDNPYTMQYGECGSSGEYIHLTPNYVISDDVVENYGPKGKAMIHEWAHLRWGVFDETPTYGYDPFYYDMKQEAQATRCPLGLKGRNVFIEENGEPRNCEQSADTNWLPEDGCIFLPDETQDPRLNASLLSHHYRDEVVSFCHGDSRDQVNLHNHEAPNEHNRLCAQKSVWQVMLESEDFASNNNPPNPGITNINPTFKVVSPETPRFVLVLDTSGSMGSGTRFPDMILAATLFIEEFVPDGGAIGIVQFSSSAIILSNLVVVDSASDRQYLKNLLPGGTGGSTGIGGGILKAIQVLEAFSDPDQGRVIVLTDGEETEYPYIRDTTNDVCNKGVIVDSLFFGPTSNHDLQDISQDSCGKVMANPLDDLLLLMENFKALSESNNGDLNNKKFEIYGESFYLGANDYFKGEIMIDSTIGKDTVFTITWSQYYDALDVVVTDPIGQKYCSYPVGICSGSIVDIDTSAKVMKFIVPGNARVGSWQYEIRTHSHSQSITILVTTMAADPKIPPIVVKPTLSTTDVTTSKPVVVNAKVTQGHDPILGAVVEAKITSTSDGSVTILDLFDNGSAPDVRRNDGVYSRYFTGYSSSGRYSVKITVTGMGNATTTFSKASPAAFNYGYVKDDGTVVINPNFAGSQTGSEEETGTAAKDIDPFRRIESAGGFSYSGQANTPSRDTYSPSKVIDLTVKQLDPLDATQGIVLTFTAPGDDYDNGQADSYEIRYTYENPSSLLNSFTNANEVTSSIVIVGDLDNPSVANSIESFHVNVTDIPADQDLVTIAFAMRTTDDAGNTAEISNIAMMSLFLTPPPIACADDKGRPISTDPFEKPGDCTHFYQCSNGKLHTMECKNDTVYNRDIGTCDHPDNVEGCGKTTDGNGGGGGVVGTSPPTSPPAPPAPACIDGNGKTTSTGPFAKANDCDHYYQCSNGILYEFACPAGLVFNPNMLYCDWPHNVPGC